MNHEWRGGAKLASKNRQIIGVNGGGGAELAGENREIIEVNGGGAGWQS